jgi:hypothetical protein
VARPARVRRLYTGGLPAARRELIADLHVDLPTGHHPPPLVQGRYLGVVGDAAGYAHNFLPHLFCRRIAIPGTRSTPAIAAGIGFVIGALNRRP